MKNSKTVLAWFVIALGSAAEIAIMMMDIPPLWLHIGIDGIRFTKELVR